MSLIEKNNSSARIRIPLFLPSLPTLTEEILRTKSPDTWTRSDIVYLLDGTKERQEECDALLFKSARDMTTKIVGNDVHLRAIIEFSNICEKDCLYCGIRKSCVSNEYNPQEKKFSLSKEEILSCSRNILKLGYPGMLLQSGEITTWSRVNFIADVVKKIKEIAKKEFKNKDFRIILSIGELSKNQYKILKESGADRYLLRIETADPNVFKKAHPDDEKHSQRSRLQALRDIDELGYHVGSGILVGLPKSCEQSLESIANDLLWIKKYPVDMIGMGPYVPYANTPLGDIYNKKEVEEFLRCTQLKKDIKRKVSEVSKTYEELDKDNFGLMGLMRRCVAVTRLLKPKANISATTAMQCINPEGRKLAIMSGANVVMPIMTPDDFRKKYSLYEGKSTITGTEEKLKSDILFCNRRPCKDRPGDPLVFFDKSKR